MEELGDKYDCAWERHRSAVGGGATQLASDFSKFRDRPPAQAPFARCCWGGKGPGRAPVQGAAVEDALPCSLDEDGEGGIQAIVDALPSSLGEDLGSSTLGSGADSLPTTLDEDVEGGGHDFGGFQGARNVDFLGLREVPLPRQPDGGAHFRDPNSRAAEAHQRRQVGIREQVFISFGAGLYNGAPAQCGAEFEAWDANCRMFARPPGLYPTATPHNLVLPDNARQGFPCVPADSYLRIPVHPPNSLLSSPWTHLRPHEQLKGHTMHEEEWRSADACATTNFRPLEMSRDGDIRAHPLDFLQYPDKNQPLIPQVPPNSSVYNLEMPCHSKSQEQMPREEDVPFSPPSGFYAPRHGTRVAEVALDVEHRKWQQFPAPLWNQATAGHLAIFLADIFSGLQPKEYDYHMRMHLVQRLTNFCQLLEDCNGAVIVPFGSFESNFFTPWGDLDLSLEFPRLGPVSKSRRVKLLKCIERELGRSGTVRKLRFISHARVPLVMFVDTQTGISCDISVDNGIGLFKSRVLRWICDIDLRCRQLIYLVKCWAKAQGINEPKLGTLNSYAISLLVVFHLQTRTPPILPALSTILGEEKGNEPPGKWAGSSRDQHLEECSKRIQALIGEGFGQQNKSTVADLLLSFFVQFSSVQHLWTQGLVVRTFAGQWGDNSTSNQAWKDKHYIMSVEDPFDYTENCARSVHENTLPLICDAFSSTVEALSGVLPDSDLSWLRVCLFCWPQGNLIPGVRSKMQQQYGQQYGQVYGQLNGQYRHSGYGQQLPFGRTQNGGWNQHQPFQEANKLDFFGTQGKGRHDNLGQTQGKAGLRKKSGTGKFGAGLLQISPSGRQMEQQKANSGPEEEPSCLASDNDSGEQSSPSAKLKSTKPKARATSGKPFSAAGSDSQAQQGNQVDHIQQGIQACGISESSGSPAISVPGFPHAFKGRERHRNRGRRRGKQQESNGPIDDPTHPDYDGDRNSSRNPQQGRHATSPPGTSARAGEPSTSQGQFRSPMGAGAAQPQGSTSPGAKSFRRNKQNFPRWTKKNQEMLPGVVPNMLDQGGLSKQPEGQIPPRRSNFRILVGPGVSDSNVS